MRKIMAVFLAVVLCCQMAVPAFAADDETVTEIIPYDYSAVEDIEFPGYYDVDLGRLVTYQELIQPYVAITATSLAIIGVVVCISYMGWLLVVNNNDSAKFNLGYTIVSGLSDSAIEFFSNIGDLFVSGKEIAVSVFTEGKEYIQEAFGVIESEAQAVDSEFVLSDGATVDIPVTVDNGWALSTSYGDSPMFLYPWNYAVKGFAKFHSYVVYRGETDYFVWYGIGEDEYGDYFWMGKSPSMFGYSLDTITPDSVASVGYDSDGWANKIKIYLSSQAAYDAAIATQSSCYFLGANSKMGASTSSNNVSYKGVLNCGSYSKTGSLTQTVSVVSGLSIYGSYWYIKQAFAPASETVSVGVTVGSTDIDSVAVESIPDGVTYDTSADTFSYEAFVADVADILAQRIAGTEEDYIAEQEKQGILANIYDTVISLPDALGEVWDNAQASLVNSAPITLVQEKVASVALIYEAGASLFDGIFAMDPEPPVIYVDMSQSESDVIKYDGLVPVLDMTWYERYKPAGDAIISGILWTLFLWRLFSRLPDILSGTGMVVQGALKSQSEPTVDDKRRGGKK